ncbi:CarboxypepD_reg-like domain-containing protein [Filimonas lacunae]|uniref:CarboxypepD_reg-like domain-containing protein n=1 Tax=Filimonas lacunae TaxID=477680 RepID=A0A173MJI7_9BACT|nr:carboxypeptidase-like regulatory domain-containing protein [Filimonas lacunae]BAV07639.1 hypothetical protein FLA_3665 [Filimonas lacunae]SIT29719.1 CarboxypepD_reg-like domain-containing protein [Filimonas lacunae]
MLSMRIALLTTLLLCRQLPAFSQVVYQGKITDLETHKPLEGASVFLSNTSYGTLTDVNGNFLLKVPVAGTYDMVVAMVGYETYVRNISSTDTNLLLQIEVTPEVKELEAVVLQTYEKNGWEKWGGLFFRNFIGTSDFSVDCSIVNYKDIRFLNNKEDHELVVTCRKPLLIENRALGYTIRYQLAQFKYNFQSHYLLYTGFPLFEEMKGSERKQKIWESRREEAFQGSVMHFMRALYRNKLQENHFLVYRLLVRPNLEKKRVRSIYRTVKDISVYPPDSVSYFEKISMQADNMNALNPHAITGDSIAYAIDSVTAGLDFPNHLWVVYTEKKEPSAYCGIGNNKPPAPVSSGIHIVNEGEILKVMSNGAYFDPTNLIMSDFWAWSEKMACMLPLDYKSKTMP